MIPYGLLSAVAYDRANAPCSVLKPHYKWIGDKKFLYCDKGEIPDIPLTDYTDLYIREVDNSESGRCYGIQLMAKNIQTGSTLTITEATMEGNFPIKSGSFYDAFDIDLSLLDDTTGCIELGIYTQESGHSGPIYICCVYRRAIGLPIYIGWVPLATSTTGSDFIRPGDFVMCASNGTVLTTNYHYDVASFIIGRYYETYVAQIDQARASTDTVLHSSLAVINQFINDTTVTLQELREDIKLLEASVKAVLNEAGSLFASR